MQQANGGKSLSNLIDDNLKERKYYTVATNNKRM